MAEGRTRLVLVDGTAGLRELLVESDGAECLLVLCKVVGQYVDESFGLLGAEIDALKVLDAEFVGGVLAHGAEDEKEVPDGHAHLDAVSVAIAIVGGIGEIEFRLGGRLGLTHDVAFKTVVGAKGDLDPTVTIPDPKFAADLESIV